MTGDTLINGVLTITEGTVCIKTGAYKNRKDIVEVYLPNTLETIGASAFWSCSCITKLHLSPTLINIGACAFCDCFGITALELPDTLATIGWYAFSRFSVSVIVVCPCW